MSNTPTDMKLYEKVAKQIKKKYPKHSAYRSGLLVKEYKKQFSEKYGNKKSPYTGKKTKDGLSRWFRENWRNVRTGKTGYEKKGDVYRPTKRISKKTPITKSELTKKEIKKAQIKKATKGRVDKFRDLKDKREKVRTFK